MLVVRSAGVREIACIYSSRFFSACKFPFLQLNRIKSFFQHIMVKYLSFFSKGEWPSPLLSMPAGCIVGRFLKREKRFFAWFERNGETLVAHTNNSGSMLGLLREGFPVLVSPAASPERKLKYTLELVNSAAFLAPGGYVGPVETLTGQGYEQERRAIPEHGWVGINTLAPNRLLKAAFHAGALPFATGYTHFRAEAKCGDSRIDALMTGPDVPPLWVECKNVTLVEGGVAAFPDAPTTRGQKHLQTLMELVQKGERAAFFYCVQRADAQCFAPADYVDPAYAALFYASLQQGVEAYPFTVSATPAGIDLGTPLPVVGCG